MTNFIYTHITLSRLEKSFSTARLARYMSIAGGNLELALEFHIWNAELGQSLHLPMQHFELLFRNALNDQLSAVHGDNWFDTLHPRFQPEFQRQINAAKDELAKQHRQVVPASLVAQFTFGTWIYLLAPCYDRLLWKFCLYNAFTNPPSPFTRKAAKAALEKIRALRNRIVHHEPIYHRALDQDLAHIIEVASWICPDTADWIAYHCYAFRQTWNARPTLPSSRSSTLEDFGDRYDLIDWTR
jgi:hypothetical protein